MRRYALRIAAKLVRDLRSSGGLERGPTETPDLADARLTVCEHGNMWRDLVINSPLNSHQ